MVEPASKLHGVSRNGVERLRSERSGGEEFNCAPCVVVKGWKSMKGLGGV